MQLDIYSAKASTLLVKSSAVADLINPTKLQLLITLQDGLACCIVMDRAIIKTEHSEESLGLVLQKAIYTNTNAYKKEEQVFCLVSALGKNSVLLKDHYV